MIDLKPVYQPEDNSIASSTYWIGDSGAWVSYYPPEGDSRNEISLDGEFAVEELEFFIEIMKRAVNEKKSD